MPFFTELALRALGTWNALFANVVVPAGVVTVNTINTIHNSPLLHEAAVQHGALFLSVPVWYGWRSVVATLTQGGSPPSVESTYVPFPVQPSVQPPPIVASPNVPWPFISDPVCPANIHVASFKATTFAKPVVTEVVTVVEAEVRAPIVEEVEVMPINGSVDQEPEVPDEPITPSKDSFYAAIASFIGLYLYIILVEYVQNHFRQQPVFEMVLYAPEEKPVKLKDLERDLEKSDLELSKARRIVAALVKRSRSKSGRMNELQSRYNDLSDRLADSMEEVDDKDIDLAELRCQLADAQRTIKQLDNANTKLRNATGAMTISTTSTIIDDEPTSTPVLSRPTISSQTRAPSASTSATLALSTIAAPISDAPTHSTAQATSTELQNVRNTLSSSLESNRELSVRFEARVEGLTATLEQAQAALDAQSIQVAKLTTELETSEKNLKTQANYAKVVSSKLKGQEDEIAKLKAKNRQLQPLQSQSERREQELSDTRAAYQNLQDTNRKTQAELHKTSTELQDKTAQFDKATTELQKALAVKEVHKGSVERDVTLPCELARLRKTNQAKLSNVQVLVDNEPAAAPTQPSIQLVDVQTSVDIEPATSLTGIASTQQNIQQVDVRTVIDIEPTSVPSVDAGAHATGSPGDSGSDEDDGEDKDDEEKGPGDDRNQDRKDDDGPGGENNLGASDDEDGDEDDQDGGHKGGDRQRVTEETGTPSQRGDTQDEDSNLVYSLQVDQPHPEISGEVDPDANSRDDRLPSDTLNNPPARGGIKSCTYCGRLDHKWKQCLARKHSLRARAACESQAQPEPAVTTPPPATLAPVPQSAIPVAEQDVAVEDVVSAPENIQVPAEATLSADGVSQVEKKKKRKRRRGKRGNGGQDAQDTNQGTFSSQDVAVENVSLGEMSAADTANAQEEQRDEDSAAGDATEPFFVEDLEETPKESLVQSTEPEHQNATVLACEPEQPIAKEQVDPHIDEHQHASLASSAEAGNEMPLETFFWTPQRSLSYTPLVGPHSPLLPTDATPTSAPESSPAQEDDETPSKPGRTERQKERQRERQRKRRRHKREWQANQ